MPRVPLPDVPCVRVRLVYQQADGFLGGSRFYLSYTGSAPTGANLNTLAGDVEAAWVAQLQAIINDDWSLTEVDCLDIATYTGASGYWTGTETGSASGTPLAAQCANGCEFDIARRYRGGKPRMYLPPPVTASTTNPSTYTSGFVAATSASVGDFFAALEALSIGSMGTLQHVNLSFYDGWDTGRPIVKPSGTTYPPKYRSTALHDNVTGYAGKARIASQKRRRSATTP